MNSLFKIAKRFIGRFATVAAASIAGLGLLSIDAHAQTYPNRPLRWIVPYAAGGGTDAAIRLIAKRLEAELKQPVVIDNLPGGNTLVAISALMNAPVDGYTLMAVSGDTLTILRHLQKVPFDITKDFFYAGNLVSYPVVLAARKDFPANTPEEAFAYMKQKGEGINYATYGTGSSAHMGMELLLKRLNIKMTAIPYKGGAPAALALLSDQADLVFGELITFGPYIQDKKLKVIAYAGERRRTSIASVPTLAESLPGFQWTPWVGAMLRTGVPGEVSALLERALEATMNDPEIRRQLEARNIDATHMKSDAFRKMILRTDKEMGDLIKSSNIKIN